MSQTVAVPETRAAAVPPASSPLPPWVAVPRVGAKAFLDLDRIDLLWVVLLVAVAFALRALSPIFPDVLTNPSGGRLGTAYGLAYPATQQSCIDDVPVGPGGRAEKVCGFVFDEVYFPVDAAKDLHQPAIDYFDPEPPLAKLLMAPPIAALGFGNRWSWRLTCAIAGSLLVGLVYLVARRLRRDRFFAVTAAALVAADGLALVESRTGVIDIVAIFFVVLFYYCFLLHWQARTRSQWRATLWATAVVAGLAFGAKLTALAPLVVGGALVLGRMAEPVLVRRVGWLRRLAGPGTGVAAMWRDAAGRRWALHYLGAAALAFAVFVACYSRYDTIPHNTVYHFTACSPQTGLHEGPDAAENAIADHQQVPLVRTGPPSFRTVVGSDGRAARVLVDDGPVLHLVGHAVPNPLTAIANAVGQVQASLQYHDIECRDHPYASRWYTWPVMAHPVLFYAAYPTTAHGAVEYAWVTDMGNPAVWWLAIPALLFCAAHMLRGSPLQRAAVVALGGVSLAITIVTFHLGEQSGTVRVHPAAGFLVGVAGIVAFSALAVVGAVISRRFVPAFVVLGYLAAWMMWVLGNERRVLFFYHMLGALPFAAIGLAYGLTALRRTRVAMGAGSVALAPVAYAALLLVFAAFVFFYPLWTGIPLSQPDHDLRIWIAGW